MKESPEDVPPASLPPLDKEEGADELGDEALGGLLDELPPLAPAEVDDDSSALEVGTDSFELDADDADEGAVTLDVGSDTEDLLLPSEPRESEDDADGTGTDNEVWVSTPEPLESRDDAEGLDEPPQGLAALPALTEGDDHEGVDDPGELPASTRFGDEPRPRPSQTPWTLAGPDLKLEPCAALASMDGTVVAASTDLFWFSAGSLTPMRLEAGSSHIHSVALLGSGWDFAACATQSGKLFRRGRLSSSSEELRRVREELALATREVFDLCQPGSAFPHTLLLRTASGKLLRSDDDGQSFRRVSERKLVALAPQGAPALALSVESTLLVSDDGGGSFRELRLEGIAGRVARSKSPLLAASGTGMLLGDADVGVLVSSNAGQSFARLPGTQGVSALCLASAPHSLLGFAAVYDDARDHALLLRIDLERLEVATIASIDSNLGEDEMSEGARVAQLAWDPVHSRLWAVGGFGVKAFVACALSQSIPSAALLRKRVLLFDGRVDGHAKAVHVGGDVALQRWQARGQVLARLVRAFPSDLRRHERALEQGRALLHVLPTLDVDAGQLPARRGLSDATPALAEREARLLALLTLFAAGQHPNRAAHGDDSEDHDEPGTHVTAQTIALHAASSQAKTGLSQRGIGPFRTALARLSAMAIVVQKFGGSSVADLSRLGQVADWVSATLQGSGHKLIVVVSAMGKTTEGLLERAREAAHFGDLPRRELDMLVSSGERVSMALLSIALHARGVRAVSLTGSQAGIVTSALHFDARIQEVRRERISQEFEQHDVVVVAGYQGQSPGREITTLGRGGSDTTAVALAAAFAAERCEIYSDVDGVYTADPNRVAGARHLPTLDYATLQEMTLAGAKVINARAVGWGRTHRVPIHARRTQDFTDRGHGRETRVCVDAAETVRAVVVNRALALLSAPASARSELEALSSALSCELRDVLVEGGHVHATVPLVSMPDFATAREQLLRRGPAGLCVRDGYAELSAVGAGLDADSARSNAALASLERPLLSLRQPGRLSALLPLGELDAAEQRWHQLLVEAA
ncbi:MAG: aspartate kinase [Polyangiaceae bacterium]